MIDFIGFVMTNWEPIAAGGAFVIGTVFPAFSIYWWKASRAMKEMLEVIDEEPRVSQSQMLRSAKRTLRKYAEKQLQKIV